MYGIYARMWEVGMYYHVYAASSTNKTVMTTTSNAKEVDATFTHTKLQCLFVLYPINRSNNKKIIDIHQQKLEILLQEWQTVWT
eukprot:11075110-Ditylum_brightwellii.AAC.1